MQVAALPDSSGRPRQDKADIALLDFLFTVSISVGLTPELLQTKHLKGILSEPWVRQGRFPSADEWFNLAVFGVGLITLIFSWYGYHDSVQRRPLRGASLGAMGRFTIDVLLIVLYGVALLFFKKFQVFLLALLLVFLLYWAWGGVRVWERRHLVTRETRRDTLLYEVVLPLPFVSWFSVLFLFALGTPPASSGAWWILVFAAFGVIGFRGAKRWAAETFSIYGGERRTGLLIYIAGPYTADDEAAVRANVMRAIDAGIEVYKRGHFPYIPHLTHFVELRSVETGAGLRWEDYIGWDRVWLQYCDAFLYLASSRGADLELRWAKELGLTIFHSIEEVPRLARPPIDADVLEAIKTPA